MLKTVRVQVISEFYIANIWDPIQIIYALRLWRKISIWRYSRLWSNTPTVGICLCKKWTVFCKCLSLSLLPPSVAIQRPKRPRRMPHLNFRWWESVERNPDSQLCFEIWETIWSQMHRYWCLMDPSFSWYKKYLNQQSGKTSRDTLILWWQTHLMILWKN